MKPQGLFITGTDTEVGKTHVSVRLIHVLRELGLTVAGMKPVASGSERQSGRWVNADALALSAAASIPLAYERVNPYAFETPVSPHLAAELSGERVAIPRIRETFDGLASAVECVVVEGVGGWRVPLNDAEDVADLAVALGLPVLLVVGLRLGCISHARLTHEAILSTGAVFGGWIANAVVPDMLCSAGVIATLSRALGQEPLANLGFQMTGDDRISSLGECWNRLEILRLVTA